ncbi:MAG: succinate dehydrogenase assembly factor 2 [Gammaproteobacteria bacterium]|nr:succinate dehydrogenase assembly factor 2 [Gammaproteobacteria bacterium]
MAAHRNQEDSLKKLLWRCRRGTKELDILLTRFVEQKYALLSDREKSNFDLLLETQDPLLTEWLCFDTVPPEKLAPIVEQIRTMNR